MKKWRLWGIAAGLVAILLLLLGLLHTSPLRRAVLHRLSAYLVNSQGVVLEAEGFTYNLFSANFYLDRVSLRYPTPQGMPPFLTAGRIRIQFSFGDLIQAKWKARSVEIGQLRLNAVVIKDGSNNISPNAPAAPPRNRMDLPFDTLHVANLAIFFRDDQGGVSVELPDGTASCSVSEITKNQEIVYSLLKRGSIHWSEREIPVETFTITAQFQRGKIVLSSLNAAGGGLEISSSGILRDFNSSRFDLLANADIRGTGVSSWLQSKEAIAGNVHANIKVSGTASQFNVDGELQGDDLMYGSMRLDSFAAKGRFESSKGILEMRDVIAKTDAGQIQANAELSLSGQQGSRVHLTARTPDLRRITAAMGWRAPPRGEAFAELTVSWPPNDWKDATFDAGMRVTAGSSAGMREVSPVAARLSGRVSEGKAYININSISGYGASIQGSLNIGLQHLSAAGELRGSVTNLAQFVRNLENSFGKPRDSFLPIPIDGRIDVRAALSGSLPQPRASIVVDGTDLSAGRIANAALHVQADYAADNLLIQQAYLDWQGQTATFTGEIGLRSASSALRIEGNIEQVSLARVFRPWVPDADIRGNAHARIVASGPRSGPSVNIRIEGQDVEAYGERVGILQANAEWMGSKLVLNSFKVDQGRSAPSGTLEARGSIDFHSRQYQFDLESDNFQTVNAPLFGENRLAGVFYLKASGEGLLDSPSIQADAELKDVRVAGETVGDVRGSLQLNGHNGRLMVENAAHGIQAKADFVADGAWPFRLDLSMAKFPYAFKGLAGRKAVVTSSAAAHGEGFLRPAEIREASAVLDDFEIAIGDRTIRSGSPIELHYASRSIQLQPATLASDDITIHLSGGMPLESGREPGKISLHGEIGLHSVASILLPGQAVNARGKAVVDAEVQGTLRSFEPLATLTIEGGHLDSPAMAAAVDELQMTAKLAERRIRIERLGAKLGEGTLRASADLPVDFVAGKKTTASPARFTVEIDEAPVLLVPHVRGVFSARLEGESSAPDLKAVTAQLNLDKFSLYGDAFSIRQAKPMALTMKDGQLSIDQWSLTSAQGELQLSGNVGVGGQFPLDVLVSGSVDANICSLLSPAASGKGIMRVDLRGRGSLLDPSFSGVLEMNGGTIGIQQPRLLAENINLRFEVENSRISIQRLEGLLNGGRIQGKGTAEFRKNAPPVVNIELGGQNVFFEYPRGVRSSSNLKFQIRNVGTELVIGGDVQIREGSYVEPFDFMGMNALDLSNTRVDRNKGELAGLAVRYDIKIKTLQPFEINNNLAKLSARVDVRLVGQLREPGMLGTMTLDRGGKVYFGGRTYYTERGIVTFADDYRIEPVYDLLATTQVSEYQVLLRFAGTSSEIATTFTSDPPLSQDDIVALLLTGKPLSESGGSRVDPAQAEKMSVLTGVLNADLSARMRRRFGISQVMIQPSLISGESDPGARLTIGQDLSQSLRLVYSMNLVNSADQIWYAEYDLQRRLTARAVMQNDNTYRAEFRQDIRFGGRKAESGGVSSLNQQMRIGKIEFNGNTIFDVSVLAHELKLSPGDKFDFVKSRKRMERLENFYAKNGYMTARINMDRQDRGPLVDLSIQIEAGPKVTLQYEGAKIPKSVNKQVRRIWQEGISDMQRSEDAQLKLLDHFVKHGFPQAKIETSVQEPSKDEKLVVFRLQPGTHYARIRTEFAGAAPDNAESIAIRLKGRKILDVAGSRPETVRDEVTGYYRQKGYYLAAVGSPRFEPDGKQKEARFVFPVKEGPQIRVRMIQFQGNSALSAADLIKDLPLKKGVVLDPDQMRKTATALTDKYGKSGYRKAKIEAKTVLDEKEGLADLTFTIKEGERVVIQSLKVEGQERVSENYIRRQLKIAEGKPQDFPETRRSIRNLYDTGAFSSVDIESVPRKTPPAESTEGTERVDVTVKVQEVSPFKFVYGAYYNSDAGPGGLIEIEKRNFLGGARVLGLRTRYDSAVQEARTYFSQPLWLWRPRPTTATLFYRREKDYYEGLAAERAGFTLQQEVALQKKLVVSYGYRFEHVNSWYPDRRGPNPPRANVSPLTFSISRSTRDDFLDPTRGSFTSIAVELGPKALGSTYGFTRIFNQYFKYFPLTKPGYVPFQEDVKKPRLVYATGIRLGLIKGLTTDQVIPTERFYAGGGTTVRGFKQDGLGPVDSAGDPLGGNAMLVLNNELRFPMLSIFDAVGFVDIGNVFPLVSDFKLSDLRKTAGFGLRLRTPSLMLRFDYGFKLDRRPGESMGAFFVSIGQAF